MAFFKKCLYGAGTQEERHAILLEGSTAMGMMTNPVVLAGLCLVPGRSRSARV